MLGGPGQPTPETTDAGSGPKTETRPVRIGAKEFDLPVEIAEAIAERERVYEQGIQKQGQELGELRRVVRQWEDTQARLRQAITPQSASDGPNLGTQLFVDPDAALARFKTQILGEVQAAQMLQRQQEEFWQGFYASNPDLSREDDHVLVEALVQRHFRDLAPLDPSEARKKLGDLARTYLVNALKRHRPADESATAPLRTVAESAGGARTPKPSQEKEGPTSLGDLIRQRRATRARPAKTGTAS